MQTAELGVFAVLMNTGITWNETMRLWNLDNPNRKFAHEARFTRDARTAYRRITGEALEWRGRRGVGRTNGKRRWEATE